MPGDITSALRNDFIDVVETTDLVEAAKKSDVLYMTRIQKERFTDENLYNRLKGTYVVNTRLIEQSKPGITIMHPLPRVDEIDREVDDYEGAAYFRQAANGVPIRMAVIALITGNE
jgi:aspartate carbamoyltransferase catalytic subunit